MRRHDGPTAHFHVPESPGPSTTVRWLPFVMAKDWSFHGFDANTAIASKCVGRNGPSTHTIVIMPSIAGDVKS